MNAKDYLRQAKRLKERVNQLSEEIKDIESKLGVQGISYDKISMSRSADDKMSRYIYKLIDLRDEYIRESERLLEARREIVSEIQQMEDVRYQQVLYYRYIKEKRWEEIAELMGYDISHIYRLHGGALIVLNMRLNESIKE